MFASFQFQPERAFGTPSTYTKAPESDAQESWITNCLADFPVIADSEAMAVCMDRTFALVAESFASWEYQVSARNPMAASIARMLMTTMSSTSVKPESLNALPRREGAEDFGMTLEIKFT